ncbi:acetoacetate--CoA ligase [Geodermatophilus nigrescens]|uniref:Acetoacetyl-CoA synthetase n=1 Tax=Geodermatophilus nigrescens TaxID=1070870 RepID=A0A1M5D1Z8_9ACTN|nr:acetoacetate--CoA ligase [Geodermatophilus nigrescens]SHF61053.1 acetoacetyl-CoA synthetase [Geodermatophilus nigrescens]
MTAVAPRTAVRAGSGRRPQLAAFRALLERRTGRDLSAAPELHRLSVDEPDLFWRALLDWSGLAWEGVAEPVRTGADVRTARFFPGVCLNYAENLLRPLPGVDEGAPALTAVHAGRPAEVLTRAELRDAVERASAALAARGVRTGGRVAAVGANSAPVLVAALAVAALGATLATATPDMGVPTLLGRFGQLRPGTLLVDRRDLGGRGEAEAALAELTAQLPSLRLVLLLDDAPPPDLGPGVTVARLADDVAALPDPVRVPDWPRLPFDHPLWVMSTSGTTGPPKALVHGAGGALLEHVKEHRLHGDLTPADTLYFHTTTAWMMWNWQLSALAVGAHVVLYDGPVTGPDTLWALAARHGVTVLGTSPAYLQMCQDAGFRPRDAADLSRLRAVMSTGAVLHEWQFDWVRDAVGDVPLQSISGGTDIVGCFVLGHPELPVVRGRSQALSLGLDVAAVDEDGRPVLGREGELVCRNPFPSRPVGVLDDPDGERYERAYFAQHPGVWTHGDRVEVHPDGTARVLGRSDGVLNVDGVRIGPSEIYAVVRRIPGVVDAMALEQRDTRARGSSRLVLLVVLAPGLRLDEELAGRIRATLRREASPAHVPAVVLAVPEVPRTHNGKPSERAARDALDGRPAANLQSLRNPACLDAIRAAARAQEPAAPVPEGEGVEAVVARVFAEVLGRPVPDGVAFADLGGTSRQSMTLLRRLRQELGRPVEIADLAEASTVGALAALLTGRDGAEPDTRTLRDGDPAAPPLFLVHGAHGDLDSWHALVAELTVPGEVVGLVGPLARPDGSRFSVDELAARHVASVTARAPAGPVRLAGYSFGGVVALEVARRLTAAGRDVDFLGLFDCRPPYAELGRGRRLARKVAGALALVVPGLSDESVRTALADRRSAELPADRRVLRDSAALYEAFPLPDHAGPVTYFRIRRRVPVLAHQMAVWRRHLPDLRVVPVPGTHNDLLAGRYAATLGARVSAAIEGAGGGAGVTWPRRARRGTRRR